MSYAHITALVLVSSLNIVLRHLEPSCPPIKKRLSEVVEAGAVIVCISLATGFDPVVLHGSHLMCAAEEFSNEQIM